MKLLLTVFTLLFLVFQSTSFSQTGWYIIPGATSESIYDINQEPRNFYLLAVDNGLIMQSSDESLHTTLKVYDILGNAIAILVDEYKQRVYMKLNLPWVRTPVLT